MSGYGANKEFSSGFFAWLGRLERAVVNKNGYKQMFEEEKNTFLTASPPSSLDGVVREHGPKVEQMLSATSRLASQEDKQPPSSVTFFKPETSDAHPNQQAFELLAEVNKAVAVVTEPTFAPQISSLRCG